MSRKKNMAMVMTGVLVGTMLTGPAVYAAESYLKAYRSNQAIYLDGQQVELEAYTIGGANYVKLRDVGQAVGFNVYWQDGVQIDTDAPYTGEAPASTEADGTVTLPTDGSRYIPQAGDVIRCDDGTQYTITDISRWDKNMFASGPVGDLPTPACDWSLLPQPELPEPEVRRFRLETGDYLFVRNLYETRRMLYTLYNAMGDNPETWQDGQPVPFPSGNPKVKISLTIPDDLDAHAFWPWRAEQITDDFNSCPPGTYYLESWDVYKDGVFQRTEYNIHHAIQ